MFKPSPTSTNPGDEVWKARIDQFTQANQTQLAALAWGFAQGAQDETETLGIDLKPTPHFVACPRDTLDRLNANVGFALQELVGIRDHYDPATEVFILVIGDGQLKLIYFVPELAPPDCFAQCNLSVEDLQAQLAQDLQDRFPETAQ